MADSMHLSVISYEGELFSEDVTFVKVFSQEGELGIFPDHTALVSLIEDTDVVYDFKNGDSHSFYVASGIISVSNNRFVIMTDEMLFYDDLNEKVEKASLTDNKESYQKARSYEKQLVYRKNIIQSEAKLRVIDNH
ncbi:ATP synthase F1 subunit epsilon [bacterium]|nr:ATP synthase F1 subunit epsilon [bacterium]|tara:strand:- start:257 stop:664 length:408 start_codon:yes stop_codon:yes gene_type:complete